MILPMTESQTPKAFVSSTYIDLEKHRAHVIAKLRQSGFHVDPMEDWSADSDEPKKFSQERVAGCQLCVLLVGRRRGFVPEGESLSITQLEYQYAVSHGIDVLVFLLDDKAPWFREFDDLDRDSGIRQWREELQKKHGTVFFSLGPSSLDIAPALS